MDKITNEQLCIAAQSGDKWAENALVENNLRFIRKTAYEIWSAQRELNVALGIELNDLVQEGSLGLLGCISSFQPDYGNKFLTYAAPAIHNAMLDYIRRLNPTFEAKNLDCIIRLDEVKKGENKGQHEFIADSRVQNPEQIFIAKETHEEIHTALEMIDEREKAYLWYRFGFEDDVLHPLSETAKHFHAVKYRTKQPVLRISTHKWQDQVVLVVEDNGIGIAASDLPRIFEKGFTGQNGRLIQQSTGIGLYLCKRLCEKLGIGITAESSEHGTAISLSFHINCLIHEVQN